ncbi:MAG TPA: TetR/AcrR family transcriptional regulator [Ktedonosporobacter sp.]|nr:TetR/AcrR family transcriptional regulator [Ktedonosporobacter sp.]
MQDIGAYRSLREKQRQEREELILQVAKEVLLEKGYYEASMDEIATRVGIAKGTLYLHFAKKEDLVVALLEGELKSSLRSIERIRQTEASPREKLTLILHSMYQNLWSKQTSLLSVLFTSTDFKAVLKEKYGTVFHRISEQIMALLQEGKASGQFDPAIPDEILTSMFFCVCSPRAYQHLVVEEGMPFEEFIHYVERFYFRGISTPGSPENVS